MYSIIDKEDKRIICEFPTYALAEARRLGWGDAELFETVCLEEDVDALIKDI